MSKVLLAMTATRWAEGLVLGCSLLAACARSPHAPTLPLPGAPPVTAQGLVTVLSEREAALRTMKAQFSIEATGSAIRGIQRMEAALTYQRPRLIRLRTFARMGWPIFELMLTDDQYQLRFPMQGKVRRGTVTELDRQGEWGPQIVLGMRAALASVSGTLVSSTDQVTLHEQQGQYVLEILPGGMSSEAGRRLWLDRRTLEVIREDFLGASGNPEAMIFFLDYRPVGASNVALGKQIVRPYLVRAEDAAGRAKLIMTFHEIIPNPELTPQDWGTQGFDPTAADEQPKETS